MFTQQIKCIWGVIIILCEIAFLSSAEIVKNEKIVIYSEPTKSAFELEFELPPKLEKDQKLKIFKIQGEKQTWIYFNLILPGRTFTGEELQQWLETYAAIATWKDKITKIERPRIHGYCQTLQNKADESISQYETIALVFLMKLSS